MKHYRLIKKMNGYSESQFRVGDSYPENHFSYTRANEFAINPTSDKVEELVEQYPDCWEYDGDYEIKQPKYNSTDFGW